MRTRFILLVSGLFVLATVMFLGIRWHSGAPDSWGQPDETMYVEEPTGAAPQPTSSSTKAAVVPIVVYHIVRPSYPGDDVAVRAIALTPQTFEAELAHLKNAGYHIVGFRAIESYFASSTPLPMKPVILSFDDGWGDQYAYAFPILEKYSDTATFFVFTNAISHRGFMTWQDLKSLIAAGMTIGDHTKSHPYLTRIADARKLWDEIDGSKSILQRKLGISVTEFAYPFGQYNANIVALLRKAGFLSGRGDYWNGNTQYADRLYELSAVNAPTTTAAFIKDFP